MAHQHDFKKLDVERARISVSVQEARDLVSQWMGDASDDEDGDNELPIATLASATSGLGAVVEKAAPAQNTALGRLQKAHTFKRGTSGGKNSDQLPEPNTKRMQPSQADSESDSDSDAESRTAVKSKRKATVSAIEAYKQNKKKKSRR